MNPNPRIIAFCCCNCAYAAADLAGSLRVAYDPEITIVAIPCTGAVEPAVVLSAFEEGADGVFVAGCLDGECRYKSGNLRARERVQTLRAALEHIGLEAERLEMYQVSAAMAARFGEIAGEFAARIRGLPPSPVRQRGKSGVSGVDRG
jgi:coenzyme F420-reducing hydrogenase delta subunit